MTKLVSSDKGETRAQHAERMKQWGEQALLALKEGKLQPLHTTPKMVYTQPLLTKGFRRLKKVNMNRNQILILWSGILVIIAMLSFPPYRFVLEKSNYQGISINPQITSAGPYRLIFLGIPEVPATDTEGKYYNDYQVNLWKPELDIPRLMIPISIVVIITTGLIVTLNRKGQKPE